ncbi:hypothetical protein AXF42_Ash016566 [Apostasia shenzhenica]|uniref:Uncharacterized protein n=1 Tax=Apostasia shenzhenica TaxID=1088818 RepID=A0A2I0AVG7_9ASPA|nr:hypothetical protein AXF42_Ash016566 [Apostasia shenzhenica]
MSVGHWQEKFIDEVANRNALENLASLGSYIYDQNNQNKRGYDGLYSVAFVLSASLMRVAGGITSDGLGNFRFFMITVGYIHHHIIWKLPPITLYGHSKHDDCYAAPSSHLFKC